MNAVQRAFILLLAAGAIALVGWRALSWRSAASDFEEARAFHGEVTSKAARITALRAQAPVSGFGARPDQDVIKLANDVLNTAGLPVGHLRTVVPEPDRALADDRDGRRAATVRLGVEPVTVQELGALLAAWRSSQQVWSVARIDLAAITSAANPGGGRPSGQYRATIVVTATYIDEATPSPSPTPTSPSPLLGATP